MSKIESQTKANIQIPFGCRKSNINLNSTFKGVRALRDYFAPPPPPMTPKNKSCLSQVPSY